MTLKPWFCRKRQRPTKISGIHGMRVCGRPSGRLEPRPTHWTDNRCGVPTVESAKFLQPHMSYARSATLLTRPAARQRPIGRRETEERRVATRHGSGFPGQVPPATGRGAASSPCASQISLTSVRETSYRRVKRSAKWFDPSGTLPDCKTATSSQRTSGSEVV